MEERCCSEGVAAPWFGALWRQVVCRDHGGHCRRQHCDPSICEEGGASWIVRPWIYQLGWDRGQGPALSPSFFVPDLVLAMPLGLLVAILLEEPSLFISLQLSGAHNLDAGTADLDGGSLLG